MFVLTLDCQADAAKTDQQNITGKRQHIVLFCAWFLLKNIKTQLK